MNSELGDSITTLAFRLSASHKVPSLHAIDCLDYNELFLIKLDFIELKVFGLDDFAYKLDFILKG